MLILRSMLKFEFFWNGCVMGVEVFRFGSRPLDPSIVQLLFRVAGMSTCSEVVVVIMLLVLRSVMSFGFWTLLEISESFVKGHVELISHGTIANFKSTKHTQKSAKLVANAISHFVDFASSPCS